MDGIADVHNVRFGIDAKDYAFHSADKMIVESKVGGERDQSIGQENSSKQLKSAGCAKLT
jgi:hypothetical protein